MIEGRVSITTTTCRTRVAEVILDPTKGDQVKESRMQVLTKALPVLQKILDNVFAGGISAQEMQEDKELRMFEQEGWMACDMDTDMDMDIDVNRVRRMDKQDKEDGRTETNILQGLENEKDMALGRVRPWTRQVDESGL
ncbi:hypothetical protein EDD11_006279 [Mortierella claussenii]|nr:hypothetical protein EDD11_006279 [Mortierella claussenii]